MRSKFWGSTFVLLVVGCLLVAMASKPTSALAICGFIALGLAIVGAIAGIMNHSQPAKTISLTEEQRRDLREFRDAKGVAYAVKSMRENHPNIGLVEAQLIVKGL